ncbi:MAG: hypothetical protein COA57_01170, partial [Flavobacteriales bacterium]
MKKSQTTYSLATLDSPTFTGIRELTKEEYDRYVNHIQTLTKYSTNQHLFKIVELNYTDFITKLNDYLEIYNESPGADMAEFEHLYLDLNRYILNILSSVRTFLDHSETRLKREYGAESEEYKLFKLETSQAYDNNFAYRFLEKLRNFAQHCGLPSGNVEITSSGDENGNTVNKLTLFFDRENLLSRFDRWGNPVKSELSELEEKFEVVPLIKEKNELLKSINSKLAAKELSKYKLEGDELMNLILETEGKG